MPETETGNIPGIAACRVGEDYVSRPDAERQFIEWVENEDRPLLFLTGKAGIGKTNFLVQTAFFHEAMSDRLAIFFSLRFFDSDADRSSNVSDLVLMHGFGESLSERENRVASQMIRDGKILLILDGLDELARIRGQSSVDRFFRKLYIWLGSDSRAKIVVSCRDHILRRLKEEHVLPVEHTNAQTQKLKELPKENVLDKLKGLAEGQQIDLKAHAEAFEHLVSSCRVPIFFALVHQFPDRLKDRLELADTKAKLYEEWFQDILRRNELDRLDETMRLVGQAAATLSLQRADFTELERMGDGVRGLVRKLSERPFGIFAEELPGTYGFSHQTLREFILAWSASHDIRSGEPKLLAATPSMDYEGAETYRLLSELIDVREDLIQQIKNLLDVTGLDVEGWNNLARNLFEAVGMLAPDDTDVIEAMVPTALNILPRKTYKGTHVSYRTKYNVARCLERLHYGAPRPYFEHVTSKEPYETPPSDRAFGAYSIRGFHLRRPKPGPHPMMIMRQRDRDRVPDTELEVSDRLLKTIESLDQWELPEDAEYLRINAAFALIRWLPLKPDHYRIQSILSMKSHCCYTHTNIFWALFHRCGEDIPGEYKGKLKPRRKLEHASVEAKAALDRLI
jgi:hypothetical protein